MPADPLSSPAPASPDPPRRAPPEARPREADDELPGDLPPMDGGVDDEDRETDPERLDDDAMPKDDGNDPFDDSTGEGEAAPELQGLDEETVSLLDAGDAGSDALDIGGPDLLGEEGDRLTDDGRDHDRPHDDYGLPDDEEANPLDGGEEGPSTDDESLTDDALPALGGGEEDDILDDASSFFEGELGRERERESETAQGGAEGHATDVSGGIGASGVAAVAAVVERSNAWSSLWERFGAPLSLPATRALAGFAAGVLAAGRELVRVDLEGATERLAARGLRGGELTRVVVAGDEILVTTERGGLFVSRDEGASFSELSGWRALVRPEEAAAGLDVVGSASGLWARTAQGSLLSSTSRGARWEKADVDGFAQALGLDDAGEPVVLVRALGASELLRRTGQEAGRWVRSALPLELLAPAMSGAASVVARGKAVAVAIEGEGVLRSLDGGPWSRLAGTEAVTSLAMLDASGTVVVAIDTTEPEAQSSLLRVAADGEPRVVAVWEERPEGEAGATAVTALAVDDAHQVVWVAGGFGVAAFQPKMR